MTSETRSDTLEPRLFRGSDTAVEHEEQLDATRFRADGTPSHDDRKTRFIDSCTNALYRHARRYASRRLATVTETGHTMTTTYADELVSDALGDIGSTWRAGILPRDRSWPRSATGSDDVCGERRVAP
jgi:hypothetical protein